MLIAGPDTALAAAVRQLRKQRGLTQEDLAFRAGVTVASVARLERAQLVPSWSTVRRIAFALDIRLVELAAAVEGEAHDSGRD